MKKFQIFLLTIFMILLALLTGVISLYALNPGFAAYLRDRLNSKPEKTTAIETNTEKATEAATTEAATTEAAMTEDSMAAFVEVPENLSEKTGYENIRVTEKTVDDEEADRIEAELSTGPTGDGLDFDPLYYPYYAMLDDRGKRLYRQIYANMNEMNPAFKSADRLMSGKSIDRAFEAVFNDHPELFFVDTEYRTIYRRNGDFIELDLFYNDTARDIEKTRSEFEAAAGAVISGASGTDYEKEKYVHNRLAELFEYQRNPLDQSAYSGLVQNRTVCAGYARSFSYIMTKLGIPCYLCTGYAGEAHGWNIICLDNEFYNVDVTWDDTGTDKPWYYEWFNKTDADYGRNHIRQSLSVYLPPCNGTKYRDLEPEEEPEEEKPSEEEPAEEEPAEDDSGVSLEDLGFSEKDVIHDMQLYYDELYNMIKNNGRGNYSISIVMGEEMMEECNRAYEENEIKNRVLNRAAEELQAARVNLICTPVKLKDGYCLLQHEITVY